mgnify:CR=1 FL=1
MWLSDLRLILPDQVIERGSIRIEDGLIAEIVAGPAPWTDLSLLGLTAMPGIVDMHGDMLEREIRPRPKAEFPLELAIVELDKRLASSGVTTAFAAISFNWQTDNDLRTEKRAREIITTLNRMRSKLLVDHYVHVRFEITNPQAGPLLDELLQAGLVHLVCLNDHTPGQGQYRDVDHYVRTMTEWRRTVVDHAITEADIRREVAERQNRRKQWDIAQEIATVTHRRQVVLASHDDDTAAKVEFVANLGVNICEFPVSFEAAQAAKARGLFTAMGAPNALRGVSHSNNLSAVEAVSAGLVDMLAADYHPPSLLQAAFKLERAGILDLPAAIKLVTTNPARAVGLADRGSLGVGQLADIILLEEGPFLRVRGTLRRGVPIYWTGPGLPC